jgi:hypothetical protein
MAVRKCPEAKSEDRNENFIPTFYSAFKPVIWIKIYHSPDKIDDLSGQLSALRIRG